MAQSSSIIFNAARSRSGSFSRSLSPCVRGPDTSQPRSPHMSTLASSGVLLRSPGLAGSGDGLLRSPSLDQPPQLSTLAAHAARRSRPTARTELTTGRVQISTLGRKRNVSQEIIVIPTTEKQKKPDQSVAASRNSNVSQETIVVPAAEKQTKPDLSMPATPVPNEDLNVEINEEFMAGNKLDEKDVTSLHFYSNFNPSPVSVGNFLNQGKESATLEDSFLFLRREIPVRLANCLSELLILPQKLQDTENCKMIQSQFATSFKDIIQFENLPNEPDTHDAFNATLFEIRARHAQTVTLMADAVLSLNLDPSDHPYFGETRTIQYFLDRLYMSWISIKMLISHHKLIYCPDESKSTPIGMVGSIDPVCDVAKLAEAAFESAQFLCDQMYMDAPKLNLRIHDAINPDAKSVNFPYIPSHLYHMFFEVFKNSMRATMECHEGGDKIPDIEVLVVKDMSDISIKISDCGGGIERDEADKIFLYLYTSAGRVKLPSGAVNSTPTPMHGLGYGLPLSRLYARYLGGDIKVSSCHGYGTDAFIYLKSLSSEARETLPTYNESSANKLKTTPRKIQDWTSPSDYGLYR